MSTDNSLVAQEPSSFEVAVRDRSWDWLLELRRRLKVDLLLVDSRAAVLLPALGEQAARLSAMLEHGEVSLLAAVATSVRERTSQALDLGGLQIICVPVMTDRNACGALLVGRVSPSRQDPGASRAQLELVASWLTAAVDAHLLSPPAFQSSGLNRVAPLAQLLGQASQRESDRELIRLFGEAIAVWHDIEVSGYVETPAGAFARDVTLPGTKKGERPAMIAGVGLPDSTDLTRLPQGHLDRFGLPVNSDVYVRRFMGTNDMAPGVHRRDRCVRSAKAERLCRVARLGAVTLDDSVHGKNRHGDQRSASDSGRDAGDARDASARGATNLAWCGCSDADNRGKSGSPCCESAALRVAPKAKVTTVPSGSCSSNDRNFITLRPFRSGAVRACSSLLEITLLQALPPRPSMRGLMWLSAKPARVANGEWRRMVSRSCSSVRRGRLSTGDRQSPWSFFSFAMRRHYQDQHSVGLVESGGRCARPIWSG